MNSAEKAAQLLRLLGQPPYVHGVTELGTSIECSKSGTFKLLSALVKTGLAAQTPDHKYTLGPMVYILGKTYEEQIGLSEAVRPYLIRLRNLTDENASFSMLINEKAILICREESTQMVRVAGSVGEERPLYAGATGKVLGAYADEEMVLRRLALSSPESFTPRTITDPKELLAEYEKIRTQGYAISDGELNIETIGIGAPVRDASGNVWAAVSIAAPRMRVDAKKQEQYVRLLRETAKEISEAL